jgi:hypothetical protein
MFPTVLINSQARWTLPLLLAGLRRIYLTCHEMLVSGLLLTVFPDAVAHAFSKECAEHDPPRGSGDGGTACRPTGGSCGRVGSDWL